MEVDKLISEVKKEYTRLMFPTLDRTRIIEIKNAEVGIEALCRVIANRIPDNIKWSW